MGILDEAIKEHLELKRKSGARDSEVEQLEQEAFGPPSRPGEPDFPERATPTESDTGETAASIASQEPVAESAPEPPTAEAQPAPEPFTEPAAEEVSEPEAAEPEAEAVEDEIVTPAPPDPAPPPEGEAPEPFDLEEIDELELELELDSDFGDFEDVFEDGPEESSTELVDPDPLGQDLPPAPVVEPLPPPPPPPPPMDETQSYDVEAEFELEPDVPPPPAPAEPPPPAETDAHDLLEDTPEFLQDSPTEDDLWFEQGQPQDFDFDEK